MVKSTEPASKSNLIQNLLLTLILIIIAGGIGSYLVINKQAFMPAETASVTEDLNALKTQVGRMQQELYALRAENRDKVSGQELQDLRQKLNDQERENAEILENKASTGAVLDLRSRVEVLEAELKELSKSSSQGALILTAAALVKDSADQGRTFIYEAEVLSLLSAGTNMAPEADEIAKIAEKGLLSVPKLISAFNAAYEAARAAREEAPVEQSDSMSWKEKLKTKLSGLVSIEYDATKALPLDEKPDEVYILVNKGDLQTAAKQMKNKPEYQAEVFQKWCRAVEDRFAFITALQKIQAQTLALMKAESLKKTTDE